MRWWNHAPSLVVFCQARVSVWLSFRWFLSALALRYLAWQLFFFMCVFFLTLFSLFFFSLFFFFFFYSTASKKKELAFFFCNNIMAAVQVCVCVSKPLFLLLFCWRSFVFQCCRRFFPPLFLLISFSIITCNILHSFLFSNCFVTAVFIIRLTSLCLCSVTHIKLKVLLFTLTLTPLKLSLFFFSFALFLRAFFFVWIRKTSTFFHPTKSYSWDAERRRIAVRCVAFPSLFFFFLCLRHTQLLFLCFLLFWFVCKPLFQ